MQEIRWNNTCLQYESLAVNVSDGHQLQIQHLYTEQPGPVVFMLAGFADDSSLFFPRETEGAGLAPFLARAGFDVYVADMRGQGLSWPAMDRQASWGLHQMIVEDIPACLQRLHELRPGVPQFWLGHGLGCVLLASTYGRMPMPTRSVVGMINFSAARRCQLSSLYKAWSYAFWQGRQWLSTLLTGNAGLLGLRRRRESRQSFEDWQHWLHSADWCDPVDGFDYRAALQRKGLPASVYFSSGQQGIWGNLSDCKHWLDELGRHDARLHFLSKRGGNHKNYSARSLLTDPEACDDHFPLLAAWLLEQQARDVIVETVSAEGTEFPVTAELAIA